MTNELLGFIMLAMMMVGIFVGFPIAFTLIILALIFGFVGLGPMVVDIMYFQTLGLMKETTFAAAPLFIFMGHLLQQAGMMQRLFKSFRLVLAPINGALYAGVLFTSTVFATATGIIGASVTVMGLMAGPSMNKAKYDPKLSAGVITAGGCLGILIPPSVMLLVMGPVLRVSVLDLFAAAIIPGVLLSVLYLAYALIRCYFNPELGPPLPVEERASSKSEIIMEFLRGILPLSVVIFACLGSIIFGIATPNEAAASGALATIILVAFYKALTIKTAIKALKSTLRTTSMVIFLAVASNVYGAVFTRLGSGDALAQWLVNLPVSPIVLLLLLMAAIFVLGWPLEWPAIIFIFVPIFLPVIQKLGFNLVWFGTLLAVNLQTAFLSPPVAVAAYYLKSVCPEWSLGDIYKGMFYFMALQLIGLLIVFFFPQTALWLPSILYK
jgi:tripartite ATP-independent transporter DctM subunit